MFIQIKSRERGSIVVPGFRAAVRELLARGVAQSEAVGYVRRVEQDNSMITHDVGEVSEVYIAPYWVG